MKSRQHGSLDPREIRRKCGLSQQQFWSQIGVTQSGGSRYESGRRMPKPVLELLRVVYMEGIELTRIHRTDFDILARLKLNDPEYYEDLRLQVTVQPVTSNDGAEAAGHTQEQRTTYPIHVDYERFEEKAGAGWPDSYAPVAVAALASGQSAK